MALRTLLYGARDAEINHAVVLAGFPGELTGPA